MPDLTPDGAPGGSAAQPSQPAQPAQPTRPAQPATGRQRLVSALLRPSRAQLVVGVLLAVVGFAGVTQVRANDAEGQYAGYRQQDLIDIFAGLAGTSQRAEAEIERLERTRDQLQSATSRRQVALDQARREAETLSILAGLVPVTGPGLRITVKEETDVVSAIVLLDMVQELRTAGAEAMQVNGQVRLVAQSAFEQAEGGVLVDGQLLTAPYVFDVIGDPHNLEGAITFPQGPRYQIETEGGSIELDEVSSLDIEAVREPTQPRYASPADPQ